MQKYTHIIKLFVCILNIFACMFLFPIRHLISLGMGSSQKLAKYVILLLNVHKDIQLIPTRAYSSKFITYALFFMLLDELSLE